MPKIDYTRPEARILLKKWAKIRDCLGGQDAIKAKEDVYLPRPNAHDTSTQNKERYKSYLARAVFYNVADNTLRGLVGQVFSVDPVVDLPDDMKLLLEDADGAGVNLTQLSKKTVGETMGFGRCGVMTDFPAPKADGTPFTRAEIQEGLARPTLCQFAPEQIINWRTRLIGSKSVLSLVVLSTDFIAKDDGFELEMDIQWRVLRLDAQNLYVYEVWRKNKDVTSQLTEPFVLHQVYMPTDSNGNRLDYIPFTFVGSLNNNELPDKPPMYDLVELNLAHYRNSADYEDSVYMVGQPTPVFTGLTKDWVDNVLKGQVQLGSRAAVPLPTGADAKMLVATENGMVKESLETKERQMVALGAQLIEDKEVQRTLGEAKMEAATVASTLVQCAKNSADAIRKALRWAAAFYGADPEAIDFQLSTDFAISKMSPEERTALVADFQAGLISFTEARYQYRQSGIAYLEDGKAKAEIEKDMAAAVDMDATDEGDGNGDDANSGS